MNIFEWFTPTRWIILGVLLLALISSFLGYGEVRAHQAREAEHQVMQAAIDKQKVEAATRLADETKKVLVLERALADATAKLEIDYEKRRMDSKAASVALASAAAAAGGRLRDPNAGRGCGGGGAEGAVAAGPAGGAGDAAASGGLLSEPLSRLLQWVANDAQRINDTFALCRADAVNVRALVNGVSGDSRP